MAYYWPFLVSENIRYNLVLHVPNLMCNLFSISKFIKDQICRAKSFLNHYEFQELVLRKRIGGDWRMGCTTLKMDHF